MFRRIDDVERVLQSEFDSTRKVLAELTDASLGQRVTPDGRSLGFLAWHIAVTIAEMMNRTGLHVDGPEHGPAPAAAEEIRRAYRTGEQLFARSDSRKLDRRVARRRTRTCTGSAGRMVSACTL